MIVRSKDGVPIQVTRGPALLRVEGTLRRVTVWLFAWPGRAQPVGFYRLGKAKRWIRAREYWPAAEAADARGAA